MFVSTPNEKFVHNRPLLRQNHPSPGRVSIGLLKPIQQAVNVEDSDERERSARRSGARLKNLVSNIPPSTSINESVAFKGDDDMQNHLQICAKLFNEGKINAANAWNLNIVDVLSIVSKRQDPESLKIAGDSMDIGVKVYGLRVDDLHMAGMKFASRIAQTVREAGKAGDHDDDNQSSCSDDEGNKNDDVLNSTKRKKQKKKTRAQKEVEDDVETLAPNPESLNAPVNETDSMFTSSLLNINGKSFRSLVTNLPRFNNGLYKLRTGRPHFIKSQTDEELNSNDIEVEFEAISDAVKICENLDVIYPRTAFDGAQSSISINNDFDYPVDEHGRAIIELDQSTHGNDDDYDDCGPGEAMYDDEIVEDVVLANYKRQEEHEIDCIEDLRDFERREEGGRETENSAIQSTQNSRFPNSLHGGKKLEFDRMWAGPMQWRVKEMRPSRITTSLNNNTDTKSTVTTKTRQIRKKPEFQPITYNMRRIDKKDVLKTKRKPILADPNKITLPRYDVACMEFAESLHKLSLKPNMHLQDKNDGHNHSIQLNADNYQYNNLNDSLYCPNNNSAHDVYDNDNDNDIGVDNEEIVAVAGQTNAFPEKLADAPEEIQELKVNFSLRPSRINMKLLKVNVWHYIQAKASESSSTPVKFTDILREVPAKLPKDQQRDLTSNILFLSLLFLCNEHQLTLRQKDNVSDCDILIPDHLN